ncbi:MAG TPA: polysaccharide deacetylase family protein [Xanthobacteraceae bacterium]|jgi:peptidoglycan/xylan/chitin deacetylase (PgdA/CDA1 family)
MPSRRKPIRWPDGARIALLFGVSWETWPDDLGTNASHQRSNRGRMPENAIYKRDMGVVLDRRFGEKCGIWRILDLFDREGIKATFFLNGRTAEENPDAVKELVGKGHELAAQPYIHEYTVTMHEDAERTAIQGSIDAFRNVAGVSPVGYLSPGVRPTPNTVGLISEMGFSWSSEGVDDDIPYAAGPSDNPIVVLPKDFHPNDYTTYETGSRSPRELLSLLVDQFDYLYEEGLASPKMMNVTMHPFLAGRAYRAKIYQELIRHARSHPSVWIARGVDIASWWLRESRS